MILFYSLNYFTVSISVGGNSPGFIIYAQVKISGHAFYLLETSNLLMLVFYYWNP